MPSIVTNFKFKSNAPNFERDQVKTKDELKAAGFSDYDRGHIVYCLADNRHYTFATNKNKNTGELIFNEETGWFSVFKAGSGSGSDEEDANGVYRTAFLFKSSKEQPEKPKGWQWNLIRYQIECPGDKNGWTLDDSELETPIWMSIGSFNVNFPEEESWTIPVRISGEDGRAGSDGNQLEFIYTRSYSENEKPYLPKNDPNVNDYIPDAWRDSTGAMHNWYDHPQGVDSKWQCEWMCQRWRRAQIDSSTGESLYDENGKPIMIWGGWNESMGASAAPILWSKYGVMGKDGDGVEYIYNVTATNEAPKLPTQTAEFINENISKNNDGKTFQSDEYIPNGTFTINGKKEYIEGWTDIPTGTMPDEPYEWVSKRKFNRNTSKWEAFSEPVIWSHYGREGFKSMVFTRSNEKPATPVDDTNTSYSNPIPKDPQNKVTWHDGIPEASADGNSSAVIWMSSKYFFNDSTDKDRAWTIPGKMADTSDFDVEFNESVEFPGPPGRPGDPNNDQNGWSDKATSDTVWMATSTCKNGVWSEWSIVKIKGERGDDGTSVQVLGRYGIFEELINDYKAGNLAGGNKDHNPPAIGDGYIVSIVNVDKNGEWVNPYEDNSYNKLVRPTNQDSTDIALGVLFTWDGDSWLYLGEFQGEAAYVHLKYSTNSDVLNSTSNGGKGVKPTTFNDLYETPVLSNGKMAKYMGIYTDNNIQDSNDPNMYKWSKFIGEDGLGYEYIYMLSKTEEAPEIPLEKLANGDFPEGFQDVGHIPTEPDGWQEKNPNYKWWTDEPSGPNKDYPYEWMCWRMWTQGIDEWTDWKGSKSTNKAVLHSVWSESGFTSFAFTRTNMDLSGWDMANITGTYNNPLPSTKNEDDNIDPNKIGKTTYNDVEIVWEDSAPSPDPNNPYEVIWMSSAYFNLAMDGINQHPKWSTPRAMSDTSDLDIDWCPYELTTPGDPDSNPENWWETPYMGLSNDGKTQWPAIEGTPDPVIPIWMATRKLKNGEPIILSYDEDDNPIYDPWVITRVKGEKGDPGNDGTSVKIKGVYDTLTDLRTAWYGPDGKEPYYDEFNNKYINNDGTLFGNNPPLEFDSYTILYNEDGSDCGDLFVYTPSAFNENMNPTDAPLGDVNMTKWVNVGRFKGDKGDLAYTHIKYSGNPKVMNKPVKPTTNGTQDMEKYYADLEKYNEEVGALLEDPVIEVTENGISYKVPAKYMGIYTDNTVEDSEKASDYKWTKFVGEDGFSYEYIYRRSKTAEPFAVPEDSKDIDGYIPVNTDNESPWWTDNMTGVNIEHQYEYMCYRKKYTNNEGVYAWSKWTGDTEGKSVLVNYYSEKEYTTMYSLDVEPLVIKENKYGEKDTNKLKVNTFYRKGDEIVEQNSIPKGHIIKCTGKNLVEQILNENSTELEFNITTASTNINVELYAIDSTDESVLKKIDAESIPILKEGSDAIMADLSNDSYAITCDNFGQPVNTAEIASTEFKMYYGTDIRPITHASVRFDVHEGNKMVSKSLNVDGHALSSNNFSATGNYGDFQVKISLSNDDTTLTVEVNNIDNVALAAMNFKITGLTSILGREQSRSTNFIVNKVIPGGKTPTLYQLLPSTGSITKSKPDPTNENRVTYTPALVGVKLIRIQGSTDNSESVTENLNIIPKGMWIEIYKDGEKIETHGGPNVAGVAPPDNISTDVNESIEFKLVNNSNEIHDIYIPLIKDGIDSTIYQLKPSVTAIKIKDNSYSATSINLTIQEIIGNNIKTLGSLPSGCEIYVGRDYGTMAKESTTPMNIEVNSATQMITVELRKSGAVLDKVMVPIVTDGRAGEVTAIYSINASSNVVKVSNNTITPSTVSATSLVKTGENIASADAAVHLIAVAKTSSNSVYINKNGGSASSKAFNGYDSNYVMPAGTAVTVNKDWLAISFYIYKNSILVDSESIPILKDGVDGETVSVANLTNDMIAIQCNENGTPTDTSNKTTTIEMYRGSTKQSLKSVTVNGSTSTTINGLSVSTNSSTGLVTIGSISSMNADTVDISITCTDNSNRSLTKVLKVTKIKKGAQGEKGEKGDRGERGIPGLDGINGKDGIPGINGKDGKDGVNGQTTYFHIKYADDANGSNMNEIGGDYIGTYVDFTSADSNNPKSYTWVKTKGAQGDRGEKGIPGTDGVNGKTYYLHIAYANSADGKTGFSVIDSVGKLYIGQYTDEVENDSTVYTKYKWTKIKGEDGKDGKDGKDGANGKDGKQGLQGCIIRNGEWKTGVQYRNDTSSTAEERYLDVAMVKNNSSATGWDAYKCKVSHKSSNSITTSNTTYWEKMDSSAAAIFTSLIVAKNANIDFMQGNQLLIKKDNGTVTAGISGSTAGNKVRFWAGASAPDDAPFRVTEEGKAYLTGADVDGSVKMNSFFRKVANKGTSNSPTKLNNCGGFILDGYYIIPAYNTYNLSGNYITEYYGSYISQVNTNKETYCKIDIGAFDILIFRDCIYHAGITSIEFWHHGGFQNIKLYNVTFGTGSQTALVLEVYPYSTFAMKITAPAYDNVTTGKTVQPPKGYRSWDEGLWTE